MINETYSIGVTLADLHIIKEWSIDVYAGIWMPC